ncbi:MAG: exodeoxyribonuclease VII small subunit [Endomicrobiia bacterium]|nr:exodeoxyribonuclease VII small subunit [Endomicrobiia bacterium]
MTKTQPKKFEDALERLEEIVEALENRDVELDNALSLFEEGVGLVKLCSAKLEETKKKIEILVSKDGKFKAQSFGGVPDINGALGDGEKEN